MRWGDGDDDDDDDDDDLIRLRHVRCIFILIRQTKWYINLFWLIDWLTSFLYGDVESNNCNDT